MAVKELRREEIRKRASRQCQLERASGRRSEDALEGVANEQNDGPLKHVPEWLKD